jgi:hypothetical protein
VFPLELPSVPGAQSLIVLFEEDHEVEESAFCAHAFDLNRTADGKAGPSPSSDGSFEPRVVALYYAPSLRSLQVPAGGVEFPDVEAPGRKLGDIVAPLEAFSGRGSDPTWTRVEAPPQRVRELRLPKETDCYSKTDCSLSGNVPSAA